MDHIFYSLQDYMVYTKGITYLIMGGLLIALPLFWLFLTSLFPVGVLIDSNDSKISEVEKSF